MRQEHEELVFEEAERLLPQAREAVRLDREAQQALRGPDAEARFPATAKALDWACHRIKASLPGEEIELYSETLYQQFLRHRGGASGG